MANEGAVISSDMEGSQEFEGMSESDLEKELPLQGQEPRGQKAEPQDDETGESEPAEPAEKPRSGKEQAPAGAKLAPEAGDTTKVLLEKIAAVETALQNMNRESLAYRALQSRLDKLENATKQSLSQSQQTASSPEEQNLAAQRAEAERYIQEQVQKGSIEAVRKEFGHIIEPLLRQQFQASVTQRMQEANLPVDEMNPIIAKILESDAAAAKNGDRQAIARLQKVINEHNSDELLYRAVIARGQQVSEQGAQVQAKQQTAANKGARLVPTSGQRQAQVAGKKTLDNMSADEIDSMSMDDLGKLLPKQRNMR